MTEPSPRARRIVAELIDTLPKLLAPAIDALVQELDDDYARRGQSTASGAATREAWIEARRRLAEGRAVFAPVFFDALRREALALLDPDAPRTHVAGDGRPAGLALLDDDVVDEDGALAAIATRHEYRASLPLLLLGQRFGVLLGQPPQDAATLPVGPQAFGRALAGAARRAGLPLDARMALYGLYDRGFMARYPEYVEAIDAQVDRAGVLPGLAFVPLRPRSVPGHAGRGHGGQDASAAMGDDGRSRADAEAVRIVNEAVEQLRRVGRVPDSLATERRETIAAMTRFLLRHGQDSDEWKACVGTARAVLEAASERRPPPPEARAWIEAALRSVGYGGEEARRIAEGLTSMQGTQAPAPGAAGGRSAREQRCRDRIAALSLGTQIGFSSREGLVRARLRYVYPEPGLLLLATEADGQEALFEIDAVARQMVEGQAWVIRSQPAMPAAGA